MNILKEIQAYKSELTGSELKIYDIVMANPVDILSSTTMQIAARYHVSQSSISRFCQKVGFNSFSDFRMALYLSSMTTQYDNPAPDKNQDLTYYMCSLIDAVKDALTDSILKSLTEQVIHSKHIFVSGSTYSSIPAQLLAQQLTLASISAYYTPYGSESEMLHVTTDADTFILFSAGNPTHADFLSAAKEISPQKKPYTILITLTASHPLRKKVNQVICLPSWVSLHYPIMVDSSFVTNVFCNIFTNYLTNYINQLEQRTDG